MIFPASSQRARYAQASLSVLNRLTRPFSYTTHLRTAKALDITIPPGLLVAANEVTE
jgi:hypothetical protein